MEKTFGYFLLLMGLLFGLPLLVYFVTRFQEIWAKGKAEVTDETALWIAPVFFFGLSGALTFFLIRTGVTLVRKRDDLAKR